MASRTAIEIAAKTTGLRADQVEHVLAEYRAAVDSLHIEPEWIAVMHISGSRLGVAQYVAEGTAVALQIDSYREAGSWRQERCYTLDGTPYASFSEARQVELERDARPKPRPLSQ